LDFLAVQKDGFWVWPPDSYQCRAVSGNKRCMHTVTCLQSAKRQWWASIDNADGWFIIMMRKINWKENAHVAGVHNNWCFSCNYGALWFHYVFEIITFLLYKNHRSGNSFLCSSEALDNWISLIWELQILQVADEQKQKRENLHRLYYMTLVAYSI